jgi:hypothetical protein
VASPFVCRSGHISAFAEATLPRDGQVGEGVSPALDARTEEHNDARRSTYAARDELAALCMSGKQHSEGRRGFGHDRLPVATGSPQALRIPNRE